MHHTSALIVREDAAAGIADAVANGLAFGGIQVITASFEAVAPAEAASHDLLVLGTGAASYGLAVSDSRSWLASGPRRGAPPFAAAFDVRVSRAVHGATAALQTCRALSRRGHRIAVLPTTFLTDAADGTMVEGEQGRAMAWGVSLAEAARGRTSMPMLAGSGQRH